MMKMVHKKIKVLGLFTVMLLLSTTVQATYVPTFLPVSNYNWEGRSNYTQNGVNAIVEFAVYDTKAISFPGIFGDVGTGQYVYAYQAFNINASSTAESIATFELLGGSPSAASGIGSRNDGQGGLVPTNDGASFVWKFENGVFVVNKHSALMVFSTNAKPKAGSFQLTTQDNGDAPPTPNVPEPATFAMLAAGAIGLMRKQTARK